MTISSIYGSSSSSGTVTPSILSTTLDSNGHLIIVYANGARVDVGNVVGAVGAVGPQGIQGQKGDNGATGAPGPTGPTGPKGDKGEQGIEGKAGMRGQPGLRGVPGDKGDKGDKGDTGTFIIKEAGTYAQMLANTVLVEGDIFMITSWTGTDISTIRDSANLAIDTSRMYLAIKDLQATNSWSAPFVFSGQNGVRGPAGPTGPIGPQGIKGDQGLVGLQGKHIVSAELGRQIGTTGTPLDHLIITMSDNSKVDAGKVVGPAGNTGAKGDVGSQGPIGERGPQGIQGIQGIQGLTGPIGLQGPQGIQGQKGSQGDRFKIDLQGSGIPQADASTTQDFTYLNNLDGKLYIYDKSNSKWNSYLWVGSKGEKGDKGDTGATGSKGDKGDQGIQGVQGPIGQTGAMGEKGEQGVPGLAGTADAVGTTIERMAHVGKPAGFRYLNISTRTLDIKVTAGNSWAPFEYTKGDKGDKGEKGDKGSPFVINTVIDSSVQPTVDGSQFKDQLINYTVYDSNTGLLYIKTNGVTQSLSTWNIINLRGPQGIQGRTFEFSDLSAEQRDQIRGPQGIQGPVGSVPVLQGEYNSGQTYEKGTLVTQNNVVFQALQAVPKATPPAQNVGYWMLFMSRLPTMPADYTSVKYVLSESNGFATWTKLSDLNLIGNVSSSYRRFKANVRGSFVAKNSAGTEVNMLDNDIAWDAPVNSTITKLTVSWQILERKDDTETVSSVKITDPDGKVYVLVANDISKGFYDVVGNWQRRVGSNALVFKVEMISSLGTKITTERYVYFVSPTDYSVSYLSGFLPQSVIVDPANLSNLTKTAIPTYPVPRSVTLSKPTGSETTPLYAWIAISIPADQKLPSAYLYQNFPLLIQVGQVEYQNVTYALYRSYSPTAANSLKVLSHD